MKNCVILSMDDTTGYEVYDYLLEQPLKAAGWDCQVLSWRADVDWNHYDLVMIRSPWDYQLHTEAFLKVLQNIENSSAHLDNPLEVVRWNINKKYLAELEKKGIEIVPTIWKGAIKADEAGEFYKQLGTKEIVIKPCISAGAFDTYRIPQHQMQSMLDKLTSQFKLRDCMIQPFLPAIVEEGEFSIFFFDNEYSHTILKTPKASDFRVQEEYGGHLVKVNAEESLKQHAQKVLDVLPASLLYVRLDFVRTSTGYALMEAELIEPSLYFNLDPESPKRFVNAVERRMKRLGVIKHK